MRSLRQCESYTINFEVSGRIRTSWGEHTTRRIVVARWDNLVEPSGTKWNQMELSGTKRNYVEPSGTKWNEVEPSGTKWNQVELSGNHIYVAHIAVETTTN